jgi:hypothetical protein
MERIRAETASRKTIGLIASHLMLLFMALAACGPVEEVPLTEPVEDLPPTETTETLAADEPEVAYPAPTGRQSAYLAPDEESPPQEAYPAPTEPFGALLAFDRPIASDATVVTGVGPPGLHIQIIDLTFMGSELGAGVIADDGTFEIDVTGLQPGIRIGLAADLGIGSYSEDDIRPSSEAISIPRVGYFYDSFILMQ